MEASDESYSGINVDITERMLAQVELEGGHSQLAAILDSLSEGVVVFDRAGGVLHMNPAACRQHGYKRVAEASREAPDFAHKFEMRSLDGRIVPLDEWPMSKVLRGESFTDDEIEVRRTDGGGFRTMSYSGTSVRGADGETLMSVLTCRDISDRKRAEQALQASERRLALALTARGSSVWELNVRSGTVIYSGQLASLLGYPPGEMATLAEWMAIIQADQQAAVFELLEKLVLGQLDNASAEYRMQAKDGRWYWILSQAIVAERDAQGLATRIVGTTTDVTERKCAEAQLRASEEKYRTLFANMIEGFVLGEPVLDKQGRPVDLRYLEVNEAFYRHTGLPRSVTGRCLREYLPQVELEWIERYAAVALTGREDHFERYNADTDRYYDVHAFRPSPGRFAVLFRDITDRKQVEKERERLNADLERRVDERTAELEQSNEALLHSNIELQHFAHAMAHDLKTPLRSIAGFAQLLQQSVEGAADEQVKEYSSIVIDNTKRLQTLIENLLAYTRLEAQSLPTEPTNFRDLAKDVFDSLAVLIKETGTELRCKGKYFPTLSVDRIQIAQVFQNLIENGIKYNQSKPPRISIACEFLENAWVFSVADNGIGIDPRHHERIFEMFRRLHTYSQVPGTGIGLALCRRIIERHGGRIWVESRLGEGSTFYFSLPGRNTKKQHCDSDFH